MVYIYIILYIATSYKLGFWNLILKFHINLRQCTHYFAETIIIIAHCGEVKLDPQALPWDGTLVRSPGAAGFPRESWCWPGHGGWNISMGNVFGRSTSGIPISAAWREEPWQHQFQKPCFNFSRNPSPSGVFFLRNNNWNWIGIGFAVLPIIHPSLCFGTLEEDDDLSGHLRLGGAASQEGAAPRWSLWARGRGDLSRGLFSWNHSPGQRLREKPWDQHLMWTTREKMRKNPSTFVRAFYQEKLRLSSMACLTLDLRTS